MHMQEYLQFAPGFPIGYPNAAPDRRTFLRRVVKAGRRFRHANWSI
jgi:hypothetical protein